ncbi:MAG: hypothetical protein KBF22_04575, partial [Ottowia sp.]|nr:hypothetical protein [Ottowia sp.]
MACAAAVGFGSTAAFARGASTSGNIAGCFVSKEPILAKRTFLDFEQPIAELENKIEELRYV